MSDNRKTKMKDSKSIIKFRCPFCSHNRAIISIKGLGLKKCAKCHNIIKNS